MKRGLEASPATLQESQGRLHVATRLDQCGDVLSIADLASVLGISIRTIEAQERQGTFPIGRLVGLGTGRRAPRKYAKLAVQRFFERRSR